MDPHDDAPSAVATLGPFETVETATDDSTPWRPPPPPATRERSRRGWRFGALLVALALLVGSFFVGRATTNDESAAPATTAAPAANGQTTPTLPTSAEPVAQVAAILAQSVVQIETAQGLGSGIIYDEAGHILTAAHVVSGVSTVQVTLSDGTRLEGTVVGTDDRTDVGVVKVDHAGLTPATLAPGEQLEVGQTAIAIGSPYGLDQTVTAGVVSATARELVTSDGRVRTAIQTDAAINPGNSGGALADGSARVIGINDEIFSRSGGNEGVGFAIPIDIAKTVADQLVAGTPVETAFLGVTGSDTTTGEPGALITEVTPGSAAATAGLQQGDVVTAFNGRAIASFADLAGDIGAAQPGDAVTLTIQRAGQEMTITATLGTAS
jgi:putative serine protease PepD